MIVIFDIETTGLNPYNNKVILIGWKKRGKIKQLKLWEYGDEAKMILDAIKEIEELDEYNDTIVGYNNLKFDVPFLLKRLEILGKMDQKHWAIFRKKWFDLYQFLGNDLRALNIWLKRLGIEREYPQLKGREIPEYFERKEYKKIEKHNIDDLNSSEKLFLKLREQFPELIPYK